jgi:uracil-DNA glycosylase
MALHESVLEEFGLAPLWVRRGMAAQPGVDEAGAGEVTAQVARADDARAEPRVSVPQSQQPSVQSPSGPESASEHQPVSARSASEPAQPSTQRDVQRAVVESEAYQPQLEVQRTQQVQAAPKPQPAAQPRPAASSPQPESPPFDAPPHDDFAWFDDLPANPPSDARSAKPALPAVQTLDWDALSERVAGCQLCRLCEKRTNTVFGVGDRGADWMLIGEAPGENEDRQGEPFVGQAGKLLDSMLRSLTLARDTNVYIANVIKCRPPGNRNPEPDEVARCEPYLQRQVALVKPKLIVALGRFAAQSLLKTTASISSLRGRVHEYEGVPVIVTYHPAYLLRSLPDKAKAWADLCLARDTWRAAGEAGSNASASE